MEVAGPRPNQNVILYVLVCYDFEGLDADTIAVDMPALLCVTVLNHFTYFG